MVVNLITAESGMFLKLRINRSPSAMEGSTSVDQRKQRAVARFTGRLLTFVLMPQPAAVSRSCLHSQWTPVSPGFCRCKALLPRSWDAKFGC